MFLDSASLPDDLDVPCNVISRSCFLAALQCFKMWKTVFFLTSVFHKNQLFRIGSGIGIYRELALPKCGKSDVCSPNSYCIFKTPAYFLRQNQKHFFSEFPWYLQRIVDFKAALLPKISRERTMLPIVHRFFHLFLAKMWAKIMCVSKVKCLLFFFSDQFFFRIKTCFFGNSLVFPRICWFQSRLLGLLPKISREKRVCQFCNCFLKSNVFLQNQKMLGNCSRMFNIYIYIHVFLGFFHIWFRFFSDLFHILFIGAVLNQK